MAKTAISNIRQRNLVIDNILNAINQRDYFLVMGHKSPDEDCISSMIAIGLLLNKFSKKAYLFLPEKINKNFQYLLNICRYNEIKIVHCKKDIPDEITTIFFLDTPKPGMIESFQGSGDFFSKKDMLKIEIDHHLKADSEYIGDEGYRLVDEASSASELVGLTALKLRNNPKFARENNMEDLFSRNFVLAVLTGIIGDSKMGKYLKTNREKWFYRLFSEMFNEMLASKTHKNSRNFSTMNEVFSELQKLSKREDNCFKIMLKRKINFSPKIGTVIINKRVMKKMRAKFDHDTIVNVARYAADSLAEYSRALGLVIYYDVQTESDLIQFRLRRSQSYKSLDLRSVIDKFNIQNGGGHPGAIGFRIPQTEIKDIKKYVGELVNGIEELITEAG